MDCMTGKENKAMVTSLCLSFAVLSPSHAQSTICFCLGFVGFDQTIVPMKSMLPVFPTAVIHGLVRLKTLV